MPLRGSIRLIAFLVLAAACSLATPCSADRLARSTLSVGGGLSLSSEAYKLSGAVGQTTIGRCASEGYTLMCGFWGIPRSPTGVHDAPSATPAAFRLFGVRPNPCTSNATFVFDLPVAALSELSVFDVSGRLVCTLVEGARPAGRHEIQWDGRNGAGSPVAAGIYVVRLNAGSGRTLTKFAMLR